MSLELQAEERKREAEEKQRLAEEARRAELKRREEIRATISSVLLTPQRAGATPWTIGRLRAAHPLPLPTMPPDATDNILAPRRSTPVAPFVVGQIARNIIIGQPPIFGPSGGTPLRWAGRLAFKTPSGDAYCTAQFIAPRVLATAAHCVRDNQTGAYYTDFRFALQYNNGAYSQLYSAVCVASPNDYVQSSAEKNCWDYALLLTDTPSRTGFFGWGIGETNEGSSSTTIGYPHDISDGESIQVKAGKVQLFDGFIAISHGDPNFGQGSSGGARINNIDEAVSKDTNILYSVNSFMIRDRPGVSYGPILGDQFKNLVDYVSGGCKN